MGTIAAMLAALLAPAAQAEGLSLDQQRQVYRQAIHQLASGDSRQFRHARSALSGYVLAPYLDYYRIRTTLATVSDREMRAFQADHGDLPAAALLESRWLKHLGAHHQWQRLLDNFDAARAQRAGATLRCFRRRALFATGHEAEALDGVAELWLVAYSQPEACDPLFHLWIESGHPTEAEAWQRLKLALDAGQRRLGRYLLRFFDGPLEPWAHALYQVHTDPARLTRPGVYQDDSPQTRAVIAHGLKQLARRDADAAAGAWQRYQDSHRFTAAEAQSLTETVLLAQAREGTFPPHRLTGLSAAFSEGMADAAVRAQRWRDAIFYIGQMPDERQHELRWQYWLARALSLSGLGSERARLKFDALAQERNYYGFLAAEFLDQPARMNPASHAVDPDALAAFEKRPAVARALELYAVGDVINARREWSALLPGLTPTQQLYAARLAQRAGWIAQSIFTANEANLWDDLELRFPVAYPDVFQRISHATTVPQPFLMAVARQESAFDPRARSGADARGLMQLLHPTARRVADQLGLAPPSTAELYDPGLNVELGGHHLARLLERYGNRRPLAAAAYNAGEHRVDRWADKQAGTPMDVWIERIPFHETRNYVKNVLAFTQVYGQLLGDPGPMLKSNETVLD